MKSIDAAAPQRDYQALQFPYRKAPDHGAGAPLRYPVAVVGAGPVGLALAIDLAQQGIPVLLLDNDDRLSSGSRAICFAKRTLEIFDRLGCGQKLVEKGVSWSVGKVYFRDAQIYSFNLLPERGHERPAFINLQQYYVEGYLTDRAADLSNIDMRWKSAVVGAEPRADHVRLTVDTPDGAYVVEAGYVAACDGSKSAMRGLLGVQARGRTFRDRFLIADIEMDAPDFPVERRFWFDPCFHPGQSVLLHKQADGLWRTDFQLGWEADPQQERRRENIRPRVRALLDSIGAPDIRFEIAWASVYTFACQRLQSFRHGRVFFAGDAAHGVSPFGARGANSGVQDAENLAWKLAAVLQRRAGDPLLDTYGLEREAAADENIRHSTRATDFITPKSEVSRLFRDATLDLAKSYAFARSLVNSGRLSVATTLHGSPLNTPDDAQFAGAMVPGAAAADAPVEVDGEAGWLLRQLQGSTFTALLFSSQDVAATVRELHDAAQHLSSRRAPGSSAPVAGWIPAFAGMAALEARVPLQVLIVAARGACAKAEGARILVDLHGLLAQRYDGRSGTLYLLRPDQHVCARWRSAQADQLRAALRRALALS
ncbi:MAG: FAD-dependent oxidoreductase [Burkholderiaceae bacterium]